MKALSDIFPDDLPFLSSDERFLNGVECGALLMLTQMGAPLIKMKVHGINEEQIRVGAAFQGYHVMVDTREGEWSYMTLAAKGKAPEESDDE